MIRSLGRFGEAVDERDRLAEVGEAKAALERAPYLIPALWVVSVGQIRSRPGFVSRSDSTPSEGKQVTRALFLLAAIVCSSLLFTGTAAARTFYAKVGPGMAITLKNARGIKVSQIPRGTHTIRVRDNSVLHNFHLLGPGVNRKTRLVFTGLKIWTIAFARGAYRYRCDAHPRQMRGRFSV